MTSDRERDPQRAEYIAHVLAAAAPLTPDLRDEVWSLLPPVPSDAQPR